MHTTNVLKGFPRVVRAACAGSNVGRTMSAEFDPDSGDLL